MTLPHHTVLDSLNRDLPSYLELELHSVVDVLQSGHSKTKTGP